MDSIVKSIINQFTTRAEVGETKYGVNMDRGDLSFPEWITHMKQELMDAIIYLEKIEKLHSNTLYYPCFADSFSKERFKSYELDQNFNVMHTMWHRQLELLGLSSDSIGLAETNNLCGHLGPEFNEFFAEMLYKRIQTGKWDHSGLLDITLTKPLEFYYKLD